MEKEILEKLEALSATVASLVATEEAAKAAEAQVEADEKAVASAVEAYDSAVKLIDDANLLDVQVEALRKEAKAGKDVTALVEQAKAIKEAAVEAVKTSNDEGAGRIFGEAKYESATDLGKVLG